MQLPPVPASWMELTWDQLMSVMGIIGKESDRTARFVRLYTFLTGVEVRKADASITPDNNDSALVLSYNGEMSLVNAGDFYLYLFGLELDADNKPSGVDAIATKGALSWTDEPYTLYQLPKEYVRIGWHKFKLPEPLFTSITYQQFGNMQKILQQYWQLSRQLTASDKQGPEDKSLVAKLYRLRAQFMSHTLCGGSLRLIRKDSEAVFVSPKYTYTYSVEKAERNIKYFYKASDELFLVLQQYFSSCIEYYRQQMPELFSSSNKIEEKSPIIAEIDTVNAIMKWKGAYPTHQDVYDTNAIFIFGDLKDMAREARDIERANATVNSHRR